jgi:hypothetical protein
MGEAASRPGNTQPGQLPSPSHIWEGDSTLERLRETTSPVFLVCRYPWVGRASNPLLIPHRRRPTDSLDSIQQTDQCVGVSHTQDFRLSPYLIPCAWVSTGYGERGGSQLWHSAPTWQGSGRPTEAVLPAHTSLRPGEPPPTSEQAPGCEAGQTGDLGSNPIIATSHNLYGE